MSRITLNLDDATQALLEQAAMANGMFPSEWVAGMVPQHTANRWPHDWLALAGRFADFPVGEQHAETRYADVQRLHM